MKHAALRAERNIRQCPADALHQGGYVEFLWPNSVEWVKRPAEHVVAPAILRGALNDLNILGLLHHADDALVAMGIRTDPAHVLLGDVVTDTAERHAALQAAECALEAFDIFRLLIQQVQGDALCAFWPDAGEP